MADNTRAWFAVLTKGSASLKKKLADRHGDKPEFQRILKSTGQDKETWHKMYMRKKAKEKGEVDTERRKQMSLKAYGATKGTRMGGEEGGGLAIDAPTNKKAAVPGQSRGAGEVKTLSVADYLKQKEKEEKAAAEAKKKREMKEGYIKKINKKSKNLQLIMKGREKLGKPDASKTWQQNRADALKAGRAMEEEASPMIKPPSNMFDNKKDAFAHAKKHGGKVYRREYTNPRSGMKSTTYSVKEEVEQMNEKAMTGNENRGAHGELGASDKKYSAMHTKVKKIAAAAGHLADVKKPNVIVKHYLDSTRGRHAVGRSDGYVARDFGKFKKKYNPEMHEETEQMTETKDMTKALTKKIEAKGKHTTYRDKDGLLKLKKLKKEEVDQVDEAHKLNSPVEIVKGQGKGIKGRIGEIRKSYKGGPKTYTVYHGDHGAIQVSKEDIRAMKKMSEGYGKYAPKRYGSREDDWGHDGPDRNDDKKFYFSGQTKDSWAEVHVNGEKVKKFHGPSSYNDASEHAHELAYQHKKAGEKHKIEILDHSQPNQKIRVNESEQIDELTGIKNNPDARYDYIDAVKKKHLRHDSDEWGDRAGKPPIGFKRMKRYSKAVRTHKSYLDQRRLAKYLNKEEVEQQVNEVLDTISKRNTYLDAALTDAEKQASKTRTFRDAPSTARDKAARKLAARNAGVKRVTKKIMTREEVEQMAEGGNYGKPYNDVESLKGKSNKELERLIGFWNDAKKQNPDLSHRVANDQLAKIKMIRAERMISKSKMKKEEAEQMDEASYDSLGLRSLSSTDPKKQPFYKTQKGREAAAKKNVPDLKAAIKSSLGKHPKPSLPESLDKVGKETSDIDNDKDVDKTDMYLHNRRAAVKKAIMKKKINEAKTPGSIIGAALMAYAEKKKKKAEKAKPAPKPMKEEKVKKAADKVLANKRGVVNKVDRKPTLEVDLKAHPSVAPTHDDTDNSANVQV